MIDWNYNIDEAPKGKHVNILTGGQAKDGAPITKKTFIPHNLLVTDGDGLYVGSYIMEDGRWHRFGKNEKPVAFAEFNTIDPDLIRESSND